MIYRVISYSASISSILFLNIERIAPSAHFPCNYLAEINFTLSDNTIIIGDIGGLYNDVLELNETRYFLTYHLIQKPLIMRFLLVGYQVKMASPNQRFFEKINLSQQQDTSSGYQTQYTLHHIGLAP